MPLRPLPPAQRPLALSMGDPAGIGPDITLAAWRARNEAGLPPFACLADAGVLADRARALDWLVPIREIEALSETGGAFQDALPVLPVTVLARVAPGRPDPANGPATIASIDRAVAEVIGGHASAVVTNPIAKSVLYGVGFRHPGHTEYLADLAGQAAPGTRITPVMMLASAELRVVPVTIHIALREVPAALTAQRLEETIMIAAAGLARDFSIAQPRIAVAGLNPHAGEGGAMGLEDRDLIAPVVARLAERGICVTGPHPADTLFHAEARKRYDAAVCMYHDQALIPIKTLAFDSAVNVTLGLPFVRTSPDHGTAFDIAGTGSASAASLIEALKLAARMAAARETAGARA